MGGKGRRGRGGMGGKEGEGREGGRGGGGEGGKGLECLLGHCQRPHSQTQLLKALDRVERGVGVAALDLYSVCVVH